MPFQRRNQQSSDDVLGLITKHLREKIGVQTGFIDIEVQANAFTKQLKFFDTNKSGFLSTNT